MRKRIIPPPFVESISGLMIQNGTCITRKMTKAGIGTSSWIHSSAGRVRAVSRSHRLTKLKAQVTNSHA